MLRQLASNLLRNTKCFRRSTEQACIDNTHTHKHTHTRSPAADQGYMRCCRLTTLVSVRYGTAWYVCMCAVVWFGCIGCFGVLSEPACGQSVKANWKFNLRLKALATVGLNSIKAVLSCLWHTVTHTHIHTHTARDLAEGYAFSQEASRPHTMSLSPVKFAWQLFSFFLLGRSNSSSVSASVCVSFAVSVGVCFNVEIV